MRFVILESPYAGNVERNLLYARACVLDCLAHEETVFASHLFYTQMLDDKNPVERMQGIEAGLEIAERADAHVVYTDLGITAGMQLAIDRAKAKKRMVEFRSLPMATLLEMMGRNVG